MNARLRASLAHAALLAGLAAGASACGKPPRTAEDEAIGGRFSLELETSRATGCGQGGFGSSARGQLWLALGPEEAALELDVMEHDGPSGTTGPKWYVLLWTTFGERIQASWHGAVSRTGDGAISIRFDAEETTERCYSIRPPDSAPKVGCFLPEKPKDVELVCRFAALEVQFEKPRGTDPIKLKSYETSSLQCTFSGEPPPRLAALSPRGKLTFPIDANVRFRSSSRNGIESERFVLPDRVE